VWSVLVVPATIGTITATPLASAIITGGTTSFGFTVANTGPVALNFTGTEGTNVVGGSVGGTAAANSTSDSVSGLIFNGAAVGLAQTGTFSVSDPLASNSPQTGTVTVDVYDHASGSASGTLDLGHIHAGYASPVTSSAVSASNASGTRVDMAGSAAAIGNISLSSLSGITPGSSGSITATLALGQTPGAISQGFTYNFTDDSSLSGAGSAGTASLTVTGSVYSGLGVWSTNGNGNWSDFSKWTDAGGAPGLDAGFTTTDTATFASAASTNNPTVTLNAVSPSLNSLTFNNSGKSYTLDASGGGTLVFNNGGSDATLTNTAGSHLISAPITLASNLAVSGAGTSLEISGVITDGTSSFSLAKTGSGALTLSAPNTYDGGTSISGTGTLLVNNTSGSGTGSGAVTVGAGSTLGGTGAIAGTLNVTGILSPGGASLESLASGALTLNSGSRLVYQAANSTATGADLMVVNGALSLTAVTLDLTGLDGAWAAGSKLTLLSYTGNITSGFVNGSAVPYLDDSSYLFGANYWMLNYNAALAAKGTNFASEVPSAVGTELVTVTLDAYKTWASAAAFSADSNNDGVANGLAWILGAATPSANSNALLPTASASASGGLTLTFKRLQASIDQSTLVLEYSNSLTSNSWTPVPLSKDAGAHSYSNGVVVTVTQASPSDTVSVNIPASNGPGKVFARLKATQP